MKLKDYKLSELKELCANTECVNCPMWEEQMDGCYFFSSRLPRQWKIDTSQTDVVTRIMQGHFPGCRRVL